MKKPKQILMMFILLVFFSCAKSPNRQNFAIDNLNIESLAVLPLKSEYQDIDLYSINEYFYSEISKKLNNKSIINKEIVYEKIKNIHSNSPNLAFNEVAARVSESANADSYIYGFLKYYREREGSDLGVKSPASVVFFMHLVDTETKSTLWSYEFDETQLPLLSDLSKIKKFFKRKGRWITAEDLLKEGINQGALELYEFLEVEN